MDKQKTKVKKISNKKVSESQTHNQKEVEIEKPKKVVQVQKKIKKQVKQIKTNQKSKPENTEIKENISQQKEKSKKKKQQKKQEIEDEELDDEIMQEILKRAKAAAFARENVGQQMEIELDDDEEENDFNESQESVEEKPKQIIQQKINLSGEYEVKVIGISFKAAKDHVKQFFSQFVPDILSINFLTNEQGNSKGIAFIKIASQKSLNLLLNQNGIKHMGRSLIIEQASQKKQPQEGGAINAKSVFVGNLSFNTNEQELLDAFAHIGEIEDCRIAKDKETGDSKGYGHIDFTIAQNAAQALEMNGTKINGRPVKVNYSFSKELPKNSNFSFKDNNNTGAFRENFNNDFSRGRGQMRGSTIQMVTKEFEAVRTGAFIPGQFQGQKKKL